MQYNTVSVNVLQPQSSECDSVFDSGSQPQQEHTETSTSQVAGLADYYHTKIIKVISPIFILLFKRLQIIVLCTDPSKHHLDR